MTQKQLQEAKFEAERQKTTDAVEAVMKAEHKLKDEIKMKTMKGDELQKWSRDEINSLKLKATKKLSLYEATEIKHTTMMKETRGKLATTEVEMSRTASELQSAKITGVASTKHSSDQYEELHKKMEPTKKEYMQQSDRHNKDEHALRLQLKNLEDEESSNKKQVQTTIKRMNEERETRLRAENEASSHRGKGRMCKM